MDIHLKFKYGSLIKLIAWLHNQVGKLLEFGTLRSLITDHVFSYLFLSVLWNLKPKMIKL
jgi:hypothetical protein